MIDLQELSFAQDVAAFAATDAWDEDGSASAIDWMRFNCKMTSSAAANSIAVGEAMTRTQESILYVSKRDRLCPPGRDGKDR